MVEEVEFDTEVTCTHVFQESCFESYTTSFKRTKVHKWENMLLLKHCINLIELIACRLKNVMRVLKRNVKLSTLRYPKRRRFRFAMRCSTGTVGLLVTESALKNMTQVAL